MLLDYNNFIDFFSKILANNSKLIMVAITNFIIFLVSFKLINFFIDKLNKPSKNSLKETKENPIVLLTPILLKLLKILIVIVLIATFLQACGFNITSLMAGLGITGLAIGFAAKETLGNFLGSFAIIADKVYRIGDYIKFEDKSGYVESLNLRSTSLRTVDGFLINVPNNILSNTCVTNVSHTHMYKVDIRIKIECSTSAEKIREALSVLQNLANDDSMIEKGAFAFIETIEDTAITLRLLGYTKYTKWLDYTRQRSEMLLSIIEEFNNRGIELDFPDSRLTIVKEQNIEC